jgi:hypothetical protein
MLIAFTGSSTSGAITVTKAMPDGSGYSMANAMRNPAMAEKTKANRRPNRTLLLSPNRSVSCSKPSKREVIVGKKLVPGPWRPTVGLLGGGGGGGYCSSVIQTIQRIWKKRFLRLCTHESFNEEGVVSESQHALHKRFIEDIDFPYAHTLVLSLKEFLD